MRTPWLLALVVLGGACTKEDRKGAATPGPGEGKPPVAALAVTATLASATLADDCGPVAESHATMTAQTAAKMARCAGPNCTHPVRHHTCQQTEMQLMLAAGPAGSSGKVEIAKVELLDEGSKALLGELQPRNPTRWADTGYQPWDGTIAPGASLKTSWQLSAPDWSKLGGSREAAMGKTFLMRVTVRVNGQDSVVDQKVQSAPLMLEPQVMT